MEEEEYESKVPVFVEVDVAGVAGVDAVGVGVGVVAVVGHSLG